MSSPSLRVDESENGISPKGEDYKYSPKFDDAEFEKPLKLMSNNLKDINDPTEQVTFNHEEINDLYD